MATAVAPWPTSINVTNFSDYGEQWDTNFVEFAPDVGPAKRRRRMSLSSDTLSPVMYLTSAEVETFRTFYRTTLKDGTLPFTFPSPRTGVIEQYTFKGSAPQVKFADYGLYQVSMTWCSVPNTRASWLPLLTPTNALIPSIAPDSFADFTTEGSTDPHYWYLGNRYASFATWLAAMGGTYSRGSIAAYFKSGLLQSAVAINVPRFPTDASGNATGLRITRRQNELLLWNRDLTNAAWTKTNATAAKTQTGIDGVASSASLLTATASNASASQAITASSGGYMPGVWVKRITGTGTIQISVDGGTTKTTIVPNGTWQLFQLAATQTLANPTFWIGLATNGDAIAVDICSVRLGGTQNPNGAIFDPVITTSAAVLQLPDSCSFPFTGATFSLFAATNNVLNGGAGNRVVCFDDTNETGIEISLSAPNNFGWQNGSPLLTAGPTISGSFSTTHKTMAGGSSTGLITSDGLTPSAIASFNPVAHTTLYIGGFNGDMLNGDMRQFGMWSSQAVSSVDAVRLTT